MLGNQEVVGDVDEEVVFEEALELGYVFEAGEALARGGRESHVCYHDACLVVAGDDVSCEITDLLHAKRLVGEELDPDGTAVGDGFGVGLGCGWGVFLEHRVAGARGEVEFCSAVGKRKVNID